MGQVSVISFDLPWTETVNRLQTQGKVRRRQAGGLENVGAIHLCETRWSSWLSLTVDR